jgi:hypothetical protein
MARRTQTYAIRMAVEGGSQSGEHDLKRIEGPGDEATGGLVAFYSWFFRPWLRLDACTLRPRPHALSQLGTLPGVAGRGHGIVGPETKLLAVSFRCELVRAAEMASKSLLLFAADQADEVVMVN